MRAANAMYSVIRLTVALVFLAPLAQAQQEERLPDLTPQEFEIRGDLQVSLPDLQRQPLRGFAPPPRTYLVPADRQPFVAPYAQRLDDLPAYVLPAAAPPSLLGAEPRVGQIDLMAGRYFGRRTRLTLNAGGFALDGLYHGFSDFHPWPGAPVIGQADNLTGRASLSGGDRVHILLSADGAYHRYSLLGATRSAPDPADTRRNERQLQLFGLEGALAAAPAGGRAQLGARFERATLDDPPTLLPAPPDTSGAQSRLRVDGLLHLGPAHLDARVALTGLQEEGLGVSLFDFDGAAAAEIPLGTGRLRLGGRAFGFQASEMTGGAAMLRVTPVLEFDLPLADGVRLYAWNRGGAVSRGLFEFARENPYVHQGTPLAPDMHLVHAEIGIEIQAAPVLVSLFAGGRHSSHLLYFERGPVPIEHIPMFVGRYGPARQYRAGAALTVYGPANISASGGLELRQTRLTAEDRAVPFVAPLVWHVSLALPFDRGRGLVQAALHAEGPRPTEVEGESAPAWADLSLEGRYRLAGPFGLIARAERLAGRAERWPGFPQPPALFTAGLQLGW